MTSVALDRLRREIAKTDDRILAEVSHRIALAEQIGRVKRVERLPLRDYLVEREVVRRWVRGLADANVPAERTEALVRWLIEEAVFAQESVPEAPSDRSEPSDVVVVGGLGQMGGWMCQYFRAAGHRVGIVDRRVPAGAGPFPVTTDLARTAREADLVVVATPMRAAPKVYDRLLASETEATIFDILSSKSPILSAVRRAVAAGVPVASVHPLFGPGTRSLFGRNLLVLDCGDDRSTRKVARLFSRTALRLTRLPIESHDPLMAEVLGLPHALSLLFARTLQESGRSPVELRRAATASFRRLLDVAGIVTRENPELVADIQTLNPSSATLFRQIDRALRDLERAVTSGDAAGYASLLAQGRRFLERSSGDPA